MLVPWNTEEGSEEMLNQVETETDEEDTPTTQRKTALCSMR